jgi:hypothetical protein
MDALPVPVAKLTLIITRRSRGLCCIVNSQPLLDTVPIPLAITEPLQQKRYSPVEVLNNTTFPAFESSWRHAPNTVTVKEQVAVLPPASVAVHVTDVVPAGNVEPDAGEQEVVNPGQPSDAVGAGKVTTAPALWLQVCGATAVTLAGQVIDGGCRSFTVTVNEQPGPADEEQVTVVVPIGNKEPLCGLQVTVPQSPLVVGAGKLTTAPH